MEGLLRIEPKCDYRQDLMIGVNAWMKFYVEPRNHVDNVSLLLHTTINQETRNKIKGWKKQIM